MEITYDEIVKLGNYEIIDLRDSNEYLKKRLKGSINVLFDTLILYPDKYLLKSKNYLLVCDYGLKSAETCKILNNMGYHTYSLKGGIKSLSLR